ncbi:MAG: hypothetical protein ACK5PP_03395 [Acidimicrobiales bacterium]
MIGHRPRLEQTDNSAGVSIVPVVLPLVVVRPGGTDTVTISVDGHDHPESPQRRDRLGDALARIAHEQDCAIRVEVHDPDGTVYADIIDPPPRPLPVPDKPEGSDVGAVGVEVSAGGFLPGEPVHIAVAVTTETADPAGRLTAHLDPSQLGGGAVVVVFGAVSGLTIVQEQS